jgi:outer membrane protein OmpA-like peptidoglycan-associated protein
MRELRTVAVGMAMLLAISGCALRDRQWGACAIAGGVIGATVGGVTGGTVVNNVDDHPTNGERGGAIAGGIVGGGALGALLGHVLCDPEKEPPPPPPAPPPPAPPAKGTKLATVLATNFDFNKAVLKPSAAEVLAPAVKAMNDNPGLRVMVEGHTDSIGSEAYNMKLSVRRAEAVRAYLVKQGIAESRIDVKGFGKSKPVASNKTEEGRAENRRADVLAE